MLAFRRECDRQRVDPDNKEPGPGYTAYIAYIMEGTRELTTISESIGITGNDFRQIWLELQEEFSE
jgi:hypothetical protein